MITTSFFQIYSFYATGSDSERENTILSYGHFQVFVSEFSL